MWSTFVRSLFARKNHQPCRKPAFTRTRLQVENLEDRCVPSGTQVLQVGPGQAYTTIQSAVNAASPGAIVLVNPGVYQEQVTITKSIELIAGHTYNCGWGYNDGTSVIEAPTTLGTQTVANPDAIVHVTGAGVDAEIQGFTIEGVSSAGTPNLLYGVRVDGGASADIDFNNITNITDSLNSQLGVGISIGNASNSNDGLGTQLGSASIIGNSVTNYQRAGVVISSTGSWAFVLSNYISATNNPATATLADSVTGVEVSAGAAGTIAFNAITNNTNNTDGSGVLLFQSGQGTEVAFNSISGNDYGVFGSGETGNAQVGGRSNCYGGFGYHFGGDWGSACGGNFGGLGVAVDSNSITGNTFNGIEFDNSTGVNISNNIASNNGGNTLFYGDGGIYLFQSTGNIISNNQTNNNNGSGIFMDVGSTGNLISGNTSNGNFYNLIDVSADYVDETSGNGTAQTGNTWTNDSGANSITLSGQSLTHSAKPHSFGWGF